MTDKATRIIADALFKRFVEGPSWGTPGEIVSAMRQDAELILAELKTARIELVEHPEPEPGWVAAFQEDGHPYVFPGREYTVTVWPAYPDEVKISHRGEPLDEPIPAAEARALAAALLAAAAAAETQHTAQER